MVERGQGEGRAAGDEGNMNHSAVLMLLLHTRVHQWLIKRNFFILEYPVAKQIRLRGFDHNRLRKKI